MIEDRIDLMCYPKWNMKIYPVCLLKGDYMDRIKLYCDGAASNNGKEDAIGGWAFAIIKYDEVVCFSSGKVIGATNQMMELQAMVTGCAYIEAYHLQDCLVDIYSDSAYIINCFNQNWWCNWEKNDWLNSKKEPVANKTLWELLIPSFKKVNYTFNKVKGHNGDKWNEYVDKLAVQARLS